MNHQKIKVCFMWPNGRWDHIFTPRPLVAEIVESLYKDKRVFNIRVFTKEDDLIHYDEYIHKYGGRVINYV